MAGEQKKSLAYPLYMSHQLTLLPPLFGISMNKFRATNTLSLEWMVFFSNGLQTSAAKQLVFTH